MSAPLQPVTLTPAQIEELGRQLATMRHDINNYLSLVMAAIELVRRKPEAIDRMSGTLTDQPAKITEAIKKYSSVFELAMGIRKV